MITKAEHFMAVVPFVKANPEGKVEQAVTALMTDVLMMIVTGGPRVLAAIHAAGMTPQLIEMLGQLKGRPWTSCARACPRSWPKTP